MQYLDLVLHIAVFFLESKKTGVQGAGIRTVFKCLSQLPGTTLMNPGSIRAPIPDPQLTAISQKAKTKSIIPSTLDFRNCADYKKDRAANQAWLMIANDALGVEKLIKEIFADDIALLTNRLNKCSKESRKFLEDVISRLECGKSQEATNMDELSTENKRLLQDIVSCKPIIPVINTLTNQTPSSVGLQANFMNHLEILEMTNEAVEPAFIQEYIESLPKTFNPLFLDHLIQSVRQAAGLSVFYTCGEKETRSWLFEKEAKLPQAGAVIHSDFEKKFISAEVMKVPDFLKTSTSAKKVVKFREYLVDDSMDIIEFKISK
jgi:Protein of unknown function (DUF933)